VAEYDVLETLDFGRQLVRIATGAHTGAELILVADAPVNVGRLADYLGEEAMPRDGRVLPQVAAERLLRSLLNERQLEEWSMHRTFWVRTDFGRVQLGRLFGLKFRPWRGPTLTLCVVPKGYGSLPLEDVWINLLLALRGDPARFFRVANWRRPGGNWTSGPVPDSLLVRKDGMRRPRRTRRPVPGEDAQLTLF
jgi:hypothetical protein